MVAGDDDAVVPPVVYLPADRVPYDDTATLELRRLCDGQTALLAYTSLDRLIEACGEFQPWVLLPAAMIEEQRQCIGYDVIVVDAVLPDGIRRGPETSDQVEEVAR